MSTVKQNTANIASFFVTKDKNGGTTKETSGTEIANPRKRRQAGNSDSTFSIHNYSDDDDENLTEDEYEDVLHEETEDSGVTKEWIMKMFSDTIKSHEKTINKTVSKIVGKAVTKAIEATNIRLDSLEKENSSLKIKVNSLEQRIEKLEISCNHNAQYSRKNTVRILGIPESNNPATEDCSVSISNNDIIQNKIPGVFDPEKIEVSHRLGVFNASSRYPRPIIVKFKYRGSKDDSMKRRRELKGSSIIIYEDLSPGNRQLLYQIKQHSEIVQGWSSNGKILGRLRRGDIISFEVTDDIEQSINMRLREPARTTRQGPRVTATTSSAETS